MGRATNFHAEEKGGGLLNLCKQNIKDHTKILTRMIKFFHILKFNIQLIFNS